MSNFFQPMLLQGQQISGYSVQPFGKLQLSFIYISVSEELYYIDLLEYIFYVKFRGFNYKLYYNITLTDGLSLNDNNNNNNNNNSNSNNNRHKMSRIIFLNVGYVEKILAEKEFMQSSVYLMLLLCNQFYFTSSLRINL